MSTVKVSLTVNGERHELDVEPRLLLVHLLRDSCLLYTSDAADEL